MNTPTPTPTAKHKAQASRAARKGRRLAVAFAAAAAVAAGCTGIAPGASAAVAAPTPASAHSQLQQVNASGVVQHDNWIGFSYWDGYHDENINFTPSGQYSVAPGQPWGGIKVLDGGNQGGPAIEVKAGRHASTVPAQFFKSKITYANGAPNVYSDAWSPLPSDLYFAFTGTLDVNGTNYPVVIGEGHNAFGNNWWVGGMTTNLGQWSAVVNCFHHKLEMPSQTQAKEQDWIYGYQVVGGQGDFQISPVGTT